jgi:protein-disulfide isomerase
MEPQNPSGTESMTRRQRRELRREQKRQEGTSRHRRNSLKRALLWGGGAGLLVAVAWLGWQAAQSVPTSDTTALIAPVTNADHAFGPSDAPVTLVEYADFQCPGCSAFHPVIRQVLDEPALAGKVRFVYRHFPLTSIHQNAVLAARAAEAAALQGAFWEMHDRIFETQTTWSRQSTSAAQETFAGYADTLGLDVMQWRNDLDSTAVADRVDADAASARQASITSTPSFFVNGQFADVFAASDVVGAFRQALYDAVNATP